MHGLNVTENRPVSSVAEMPSPAQLCLLSALIVTRRESGENPSVRNIFETRQTCAEMAGVGLEKTRQDTDIFGNKNPLAVTYFPTPLRMQYRQR